MITRGESCGKRNTKSETYLILSILVLLIGILIVNLNQLNGITIIGDEYGYWAAGAYFAGYDWSEVTSLNPYYAYGYGFILCILMKLIPDMVMAYKAAILLNIVFLCASFWLTVKIARLLFPEYSGKLLILASGCITFYSNTLFQSQTTQVEILLYFLFCLLTYVFILYMKSRKIRYGIYACLISSYMFTVHMRCVSVIGALVMVLLFLLWREKTKKTHVAIFFVLLAALFATSLYLKNEVKNNAYVSTATSIEEESKNENETVETNSANDFSGQTGKIKSLFSIEGIKNFLVSVIGKLYYLCVSSFLLILWAVYYLIHSIVQMIRKKTEKKGEGWKEELLFFLTLTLLFTMGVSALFMIDITRQDTLIYGRYNEYICAPLFLIGLITFLEEGKDLKKHYVMILVFLCMAGVVGSVLDATQIEQLYDNNVVGIVYWIIKIFGDVGSGNFAWVVAIEVLSVYLLLAFTQYLIKNKKYRYMVVIGFCTFLWIVLAREVFDHNTKRQQIRVKTDYDLLEEVPDTQPIYMVTSDTDYIYVDYLQFFQGKEKVSVIEMDDVTALEDGAYIFGYEDAALNLRVENLRYIGESKHFILYQKQS
jgi:hypothetical protein